MIEKVEDNRKCAKCGMLSIAPWHSRALYCDRCIDFARSTNRDDIGNDDADRWIADNWKDDNEKAFEDSRC